MLARLKGNADFPDIKMIDQDDLTIDDVIELELFVERAAEYWSTTLTNKLLLWKSGVTQFGLDAAPSWGYLGGLRPQDIERIPEPEDEADPPAAAGAPSPAADEADDPAGPGSTPASSST